MTNMEQITQIMVDCWRANYGLDTRSPADAARYWTETCAGMAPAGAVAALGLLLQEREELKNNSERYRWLRDHPLWSVGYRVKPRARTKEWRMRDEGDYWGSWWPTHEQAIDHAMSAG